MIYVELIYTKYMTDLSVYLNEGWQYPTQRKSKIKKKKHGQVAP